MLLILFQKHPQLLAQRVGKIVRKPVQPFSLPLLSHNLIRRKCLTFRRSRPPAAAAELKALVPSHSVLCRPPLTPALRPSQRFLLGGFGAVLGFACVRFVGFKPFWPLALVQQARAAIFLAALRRFRGPALFHGWRQSSSLGAPFWPSGLTLRSSGLAFSQPLTLAVNPAEKPLYLAHAFSNGV